jgi:hypothetical protein
MTLESRSPWLLGRCSRQLPKSCADADMVYSWAELMFVLTRYCTLCYAVSEAFSSAYPDDKVPNKTIQWLVTSFRGTGSVCGRRLVQHPTVLMGEMLHNSEEMMSWLPLKSLGRLSQHSWLPVKSANWATEQLKLYSYQFQTIHQLQQRIEVWELNIAIGFIVLCVWRCSYSLISTFLGMAFGPFDL